MTWFDWMLIGILLLNSVAYVLAIGEPRTPISKGAAALHVLLNASLVFILVSIRT